MVEYSKKVNFYVSHLTSYCLRQAFYKMTRRDLNKPTPSQKLGENTHHKIFALLSAFGTFEIEPRVTLDCGEFSITGKPDVLTEEAVYEIKTTANVPDKPYFDNAMQTQFYAHVTDRNHGFVLYVTPDLSTTKKFKVNRREPRFVLKNAEKLYSAIVNLTPPEPRPSKFCQYCCYKSLCGAQ